MKRLKIKKRKNKNVKPNTGTSEQKMDEVKLTPRDDLENLS